MQRSILACVVVFFLVAYGSSIMAESRSAYDLRVSSSVKFDQGLHDTWVQQRLAVHGPLDAKQLATFRDVLLRAGWPTVTSAGRDGVDAAGDMARFATDDYGLQDALEQVIGSRVGIDIDGLAFARLVDDIEFAHGRRQQFGTLLKLDGPRVVTSPAALELEANRARDFVGLPLLQDYLRAVQARVDAGQPIDQANAIPRLSTPATNPTDLPLLNQLYSMVSADQGARNNFAKEGMKSDSALREKIQEVDRKNLHALKAIFAKSGFPTVAMVGREGVSTVFLLVQHADADREFQKHAMELAKPLMERSELPRSLYAMLVDRVRLADGKLQLYGTQVKIVDGKVEALPVEDPERLDTRRRSVALAPEADYLKEFHIPAGS
jgi:hypothetical protein